jgi:hypothetical protein
MCQAKKLVLKNFDVCFQTETEKTVIFWFLEKILTQSVQAKRC